MGTSELVAATLLPGFPRSSVDSQAGTACCSKRCGCILWPCQSRNGTLVNLTAMTDDLIRDIVLPHLRTQFEKARGILFTGAGFSRAAAGLTLTKQGSNLLGKKVRYKKFRLQKVPREIKFRDEIF